MNRLWPPSGVSAALCGSSARRRRIPWRFLCRRDGPAGLGYRPLRHNEPRGLPAFHRGAARVPLLVGDPTEAEDVWDFEGLGFDMTTFTMREGVYGEVAYGTIANFLTLHGGPHEVLVDKTGLLEGVTFPLL